MEFSSGQPIVRISLQYGQKQTRTDELPEQENNFQFETSNAATSPQNVNQESKFDETQKLGSTVKEPKLKSRSTAKKVKLKEKQRVKEIWKVVLKNTQEHAGQKMVLKKITCNNKENPKATESSIKCQTTDVAPMFNDGKDSQISHNRSRLETNETNSNVFEINSNFRMVQQSQKKIMSVAPNMVSTTIFPDANQELKDIKQDIDKFHDDSETQINSFDANNLDSPVLPSLTNEFECDDENSLSFDVMEVFRQINEQLKCKNHCHNEPNIQRWLNPHIIQYDDI